jgi:hypothetical protein
MAFRNGTATSDRDEIADFGIGADRIHLAGIDADTSKAGNQAFIWLGVEAFSGTAGEARAETVASRTYVFLDMDGDQTADYSIVLRGVHDLTMEDFIL